jgi:spermidine synthase
VVVTILYLAFAFSGAAALIYETTWTRLLTLFMGHTVAAASTVLAAFMGGLAVGAAIAGRVSGRLERSAALRAYAAVEILIAVFALVLPLELRLLEPLLASAYADGSGGAPFAAIRLLCALLVVTLPAVAMGTTLPLVIRWHGGSAERAGHDTALLYAANTFGAAAGAVLSGFVLLPALGMRGTTIVAVALNALSAAIAWRLAPATVTRALPSEARPSPRAAGRTARSSRRPSRPAPRPLVAMVALAISGCASLVLQVAWTRIVALILGPTTFAFSAMVATFITGIALGALLAGWIAKRAASTGRLAWMLAGSLLLSGLAATIAAGRAPMVPLVVADAVSAPDAGFNTVVRLQSLLIAALMLPMTIGFGAAFPFGVALAARDDERVPRDVARVYVANTAGAIAGALIAGFLLVPWLGLQNTVRAAAALTTLGAAFVGVSCAGRRAQAAAACGFAAAALSLLALIPPWDPRILSSGAYKYAPYLESEYRDALLRAGRLLYYREGAAATVSVREMTGARSLAIDGKVDASNAGDMLTQRLLAHVPLLLHPAPRTVGIVGLGSGVTLGSALRHPIARADMLEISPEVVEASNFFRAENHAALADPRTRLIVGDGRTHVALARQRYDVIISEPSNPWMAGVAALFTREFFAAAKARLEPDGILCQWAHTYDISEADLRSIVATFLSVFPEASLWLVGDGDILLVGSAEPIGARLAGVRSAWSRSGVAADLRDVGVRDPESLLTLFVADGGRLGTYVEGAAIQHDDRMSLEFSGPQGIYGRTEHDNAAVLRRLAAAGPQPDAVRAAWQAPATAAHRGAMHLRAEAFGAAFEDFVRALRNHPPDRATVEGLLRAAASARRLGDAEALLAELHSRDAQNVSVAVGLSRLVAARGDLARAGDPLRPLLSQRPPDVAVIDQLASIFADAGDRESLAVAAADLQRLAPESEPALYYGATLRFMEDRPAEAIAVAERLRQLNPRHARGLNLLGAAYASVGRRDAARQAFEASIAADPREPGTYVNLGTFELQAGRPVRAESYFAEALTIDASLQAAQQGLEQAMAALR